MTTRIVHMEGGGVASGEAWAAMDEASRIRHRGEEHARAAISRAEAQVATIHRAAEQEGRLSGQAQAASLVQQASQAFQGAIEHAQEQVLELALACAKQILQTELQQDPQAMARLVRRAIAEAGRCSRVTVHVHPDDMPLVAQKVAMDSVRFEQDASLGRGDCVVHTDVGKVDARLDIQLSALQKAMDQAF